MQLLGYPQPPHPLGVIARKIPAECGKNARVVAENLPVRSGFEAGMIQPVPLFLGEEGRFRVALDIQYVGIEPAYGHDAPSLAEPFGKIGALHAVHKLVIGDGKQIAEPRHILVGQPQAHARAEIVIA